jgi:flagellar basal body-associated protein FliL
MNNKIKTILWIIGIILAVLLFFAAAFYFWPTTDRKFQIATSESATHQTYCVT